MCLVEYCFNLLENNFVDTVRDKAVSFNNHSLGEPRFMASLLRFFLFSQSNILFWIKNYDHVMHFFGHIGSITTETRPVLEMALNFQGVQPQVKIF